MRVLIIVPAYNEEKSLPLVLRRLRGHCPELDILVVDDASRDGTFRAARQAGLRAISLPENRGIGGAVKAGYNYAVENEYDAAVQFDGDGQHNPAEVEALLAPVREGTADMVIGSRFLDHAGYQSEPVRRLGIHVFARLTSLAIGQRITDVTSGFRAIGPKLLSDFAQSYPTEYPDAAAIIQAKMLGFRIVEIPTIMAPRASGTSSFNLRRQLAYPLKTLLSILTCRLRGSP